MAENIINIPSGDMEKSIYDADNNGIVDNSEQLGSQLPDYYLSYGTNQDTASNILALNPTIYLNQTWWATDERRRYIAVASTTEGIDIWQAIDLLYEKETDTFVLTSTQDGQTQNLGQEQFMMCHTLEITPITALEPKVLLVTGIHTGVGTIKEVTLPVAADLTDGSIFGVNTTDKNTNGYLKVTVFGDINNVKTDQWAAKAILYLDPITPGLLTDVKPLANAFAVAQVTVSHVSAGKLFINTVRAVSDQALFTPAGVDLQYFTGDQTDAGDPAGLDNFYLILLNDKGTVASASEDVICPDNTITGVAKDHLNPQAIIDTQVIAGAYRFHIDYMVSTATDNEKLHVEIYLAAADGTVLDSGTGLPVGSLGQPPIGVGESGLLNSAAGVILNETILVSLASPVIRLVGQRVLVHFLGEKVGTGPGDLTITFYYGSDHQTFVEVPRIIYFTDLADVSIQTPVTGEIPMVGVDDIWRNTNPAALITGRMKWQDEWVGGSYVKDDTVRDGNWTMVANKDTDDRPAPQPEGDAMWGLSDTPTWDDLQVTDTIRTGVRISGLLDSYSVTAIRVWIPNISADAYYRIIAVDNNTGVIDFGEAFSGDRFTSIGWKEITLKAFFLGPGDDQSFLLLSENHATTTVTTEPWAYIGSSNQEIDPGTGNISVRGDQSIVRVSDIDNNAVDQSVLLASAISGTDLTIEDAIDSTKYYKYDVISSVDNTTWYSFNTVLLETGSGGAPDLATANITFEVPIPAPVDYVRILNGTLPLAFSQGEIKIGTGITVNDDNAYGVDLYHQLYISSPDWDILTQGDGGSSSSGGTSVHDELLGRDIPDQHPISAITDLQTELDGKELSLGNPIVDGYILSSTILGVRSWIEMSGGGASGFSVNQVAHGFVIGDPVTEAGGIWSRADTSLEANTAEGLIIEVVDVDNFIASTLGEIEWLGHGQPINSWLYLDASGNYTVTAPSVEGEIVQYCFKTMDAARVYINVSQPEVIAVAGGGGTGDMSKVVYDIDDNGVVDDSEKLGGQLPNYYLSSPIDFSASDLVVVSDGLSGAKESLVEIDAAGIMSNALIDSANNVITGIDRPELGVDVVSELANLDGLAFDKLDLVIVSDVGLQLDVEKVGGGDVRFLIDGVIATLDCTTGAGIGGKARIALVEGVDVNNPETNWIYATQLAGVASLNINTGINLPTGAFTWIGKIKVADAITWGTSGAFVFQRFTEAFANDSRGTQSHEREKLRALGALYIDGVAQTLTITPNVAVPDNVHLETTAGSVYQLHRQGFPAYTVGPYYYGNGLNIFEQFPDLNNILTTQDGSVIGNNDRFNLIVWGAVNITSGECKLFINKPNGVYGSDSQALADVDNTADYTVADGMKTVAFMISRVVLSYSAGNGGDWTELGTFSILGTQVGNRVGGATNVASNEFADTQFRVFDDGDPTKEIALQAANIATATTRTIIMPDADVDLGNLIDNDTTGTTSVVNSVWLGTELEYTNLGTYDPAVLYFRTA